MEIRWKQKIQLVSAFCTANRGDLIIWENGYVLFIERETSLRGSGKTSHVRPCE